MSTSLIFVLQLFFSSFASLMDVLVVILVMTSKIIPDESCSLSIKSSTIHNRPSSNNPRLTRHLATTWMRTPKRHLKRMDSAQEPSIQNLVNRKSIDTNSSDWRLRRPPLHRGVNELRPLDQIQSSSDKMHDKAPQSTLKRRPISACARSARTVATAEDAENILLAPCRPASASTLGHHRKPFYRIQTPQPDLWIGRLDAQERSQNQKQAPQSIYRKHNDTVRTRTQSVRFL